MDGLTVDLQAKPVEQRLSLLDRLFGRVLMGVVRAMNPEGDRV